MPLVLVDHGRLLHPHRHLHGPLGVRGRRPPMDTAKDTSQGVSKTRHENITTELTTYVTHFQGHPDCPDTDWRMLLAFVSVSHGIPLFVFAQLLLLMILLFPFSWLCCYMAQMNPLIGPELNQKTLFAVRTYWVRLKKLTPSWEFPLILTW